MYLGEKSVAAEDAVMFAAKLAPNRSCDRHMTFEHCSKSFFPFLIRKNGCKYSQHRERRKHDSCTKIGKDTENSGKIVLHILGKNGTAAYVSSYGGTGCVSLSITFLPGCRCPLDEPD